MMGRISSVGMFNTILEKEGNGKAGRTFIILPNQLLADKAITVEGGETPQPFEHGMKDRMLDFHDKFQEQMAGQQSPNNGGNS